MHSYQSWQVRRSELEKVVPGLSRLVALSRLRHGQPIEANFEGEGVWYAGTVQQLHSADGTVTVAYHDGDVRRESYDHVRPITLDESELSEGLMVEVQVEADSWECARVVRRNSDGTWAVKAEKRRLMEHELPINIRRLLLLTDQSEPQPSMLTDQPEPAQMADQPEASPLADEPEAPLLLADQSEAEGPQPRMQQVTIEESTAEGESGATSGAGTLSSMPRGAVRFLARATLAVSLWAQCDQCRKWRRMPHGVECPGEFDYWECSLIGTACDAAEETSRGEDTVAEDAPDPVVTAVLSHHVYSSARAGSLCNVYARGENRTIRIVS